MFQLPQSPSRQTPPKGGTGRGEGGEPEPLTPGGCSLWIPRTGQSGPGPDLLPAFTAGGFLPAPRCLKVGPEIHCARNKFQNSCGFRFEPPAKKRFVLLFRTCRTLDMHSFFFFIKNKFYFYL